MVHPLKRARTETRGERAWLAVYLFYEEPWERFLAEAVKPFAERAIRESWAERFFFIRYWEEGAHIRVRFEGDPSTLTGRLLPELTKTFRSYFRSNPSARPRGRGKGPAGAFRHRNNAVVRAVYEPETERYGGSTGRDIAERQFDASSRAVLSLLKKTRSWSYERRMGAGFQMHVTLTDVLGMDSTAAARFFARVGRPWFGAALGRQAMVDEESLDARRQVALRAFETIYQKSRRALQAHRKALRDTVIGGRLFGEPWLDTWVRDMRKVAVELQEAQQAGLLAIPWKYLPGPRGAREELWPVLSSYVHMTNNRLGIFNRDEAQLAYLLSRTLAGR